MNEIKNTGKIIVFEDNGNFYVVCLSDKPDFKYMQPQTLHVYFNRTIHHYNNDIKRAAISYSTRGSALGFATKLEKVMR